MRVHTEEQLAGVAARRQFFKDAAAVTRYVSADVETLHYLVSTSDEKVGGKLFCSGWRGELRTLTRAVAILKGRDGWQPRDFLDVGANIGTTSLPALAVHGFERAVCVEPDPENARLLRVNAQLNGLSDRVQIVEAALAASAGVGTLRRHPENSGGHTLIKKRADPGSKSLVAVRVDTIAALVDAGVIDPERVGMLWIDVQGHEEHVLAAADALIDRQTPVVLEVTRKRDVGWIAGLAERYQHVANLRKELRPVPAGFVAELLGRETDVDLLFF